MPISPPPRTPVSPLAHALQGAAALLLVTAVPVAIVGLLGQDDDPTIPPAELDHAVQPLDISAGLMTTIGVGALVLVAATGAFLIHAGRRGATDPRRWQVLCPLVGIGLVLGFGYHIATAGVVGANIGYGLVVLFGGPLTVLLLMVAVAREWMIHRRPGRRGIGAA